MISQRFECKELEWLIQNDPPIDYLGMMMSIDDLRTYLSMEKYIDLALDVLSWSDLKPASTPIDAQINPKGDSPALPPHLASQYAKALGQAGWLSTTCRPDIAYAVSRLGQHQAKSTILSEFTCCEQVSLSVFIQAVLLTVEHKEAKS